MSDPSHHAPWERLSGESAKAFAAFCLYRDQGPRRSVDAASRAYHERGSGATASDPTTLRRRASGQIGRWARRWNWQARAVAWDEELERTRRLKQIEAVGEMVERHVREALMLQNKAVERIRLLRADELKPRDVLSYLLESVKLERLARGEPTERVAEQHTFPKVEELSDEQLARIILSAGSSDRTAPPPGGTSQSA
jgi:hypothetical protein